MSSNPDGGFVVATARGNHTQMDAKISLTMLNDIARMLNIPLLDDSARSIYVYRSTVAPHAQPPHGGGSKAG
jgi:hypothetical protein